MDNFSDFGGDDGLGGGGEVAGGADEAAAGNPGLDGEGCLLGERHSLPHCRIARFLPFLALLAAARLVIPRPGESPHFGRNAGVRDDGAALVVDSCIFHPGVDRDGATLRGV